MSALHCKAGIWVILGPDSFLMLCIPLKKQPKQHVIQATADATDELPPHLFQQKGVWLEKRRVALRCLKSNSSPDSFANLFPAHHLSLKNSELRSFEVTAQDVGRESKSWVVFQADPAPLHGPPRCQPCCDSAGA